MHRGHVPVLGLLKELCLFDLHNLDVVQVLCAAPDHFSKGIDFALLDDPRLCARDDALRGPPREGASLEDEPGCEEGARVCLSAVDDVAGDDVGGIWVGVAEKEGEGDDGPGIAGDV